MSANALRTPDWSTKLHTSNTNGKSFPRDGLFWAVTDQGNAVEVAYDEQATFWLPAHIGPYFSRQDGEPGCYAADELIGWADTQEAAEDAASLYLMASR